MKQKILEEINVALKPAILFLALYMSYIYIRKKGIKRKVLGVALLAIFFQKLSGFLLFVYDVSSSNVELFAFLYVVLCVFLTFIFDESIFFISMYTVYVFVFPFAPFLLGGIFLLMKRNRYRKFRELNFWEAVSRLFVIYTILYLGAGVVGFVEEIPSMTGCLFVLLYTLAVSAVTEIAANYLYHTIKEREKQDIFDFKAEDSDLIITFKDNTLRPDEIKLITEFKPLPTLKNLKDHGRKRLIYAAQGTRFAFELDDILGTFSDTTCYLTYGHGIAVIVGNNGEKLVGKSCTSPLCEQNEQN